MLITFTKYYFNVNQISQVTTVFVNHVQLLISYATNCVDCQRLQARWEAVGAKLKTRLNTARVNRQTSGKATSRRFGIVETPTFLL